MKKYRIISFLSAILFAFCLISSAVFAASEDELEAQKSEAQDKRDAAQYQVDLSQNTIDGIDQEIKKANDALDKISDQTKQLDSQIGDLNVQIKDNEKKCADTQKKFEKKQKEYDGRMRASYMFDYEVVIEMLFNSKSYSDLISRVEVIVAIAKSDTDAMKELQTLQDDLKREQKSLQDQKTSLDSKKQEQEELKAEQESIKSQLNTLRAQNKEILDAYKAEVEEQNAIIAAADAELAEIARQKQQETAHQSSGGSVSSGYIWPCDYYTITDYFGWREQPTAGASTYHQGIDIGAPGGANIYAAASGWVSLAGWNGGYGNCVIIDHMNGYSTLYGHQSAINVYEGQWVNQGDVIGWVGTTGVSTGNHLHFSFIDSNGNFVDPYNFY